MVVEDGKHVVRLHYRSKSTGFLELNVRNRRALPRPPRREEISVCMALLWSRKPVFSFTLLLGLLKVLLVKRLLLRALLARGSHHCALFVRQTPIGCCVSDILIVRTA
jgi:hypothetical protein